jgi:hypothetical protein
MPGPPDDVEPGELFRKLMERPAPSAVIPFPRKDEHGKPIGSVRIQVLSMTDHDDARLDANEKLKKKVGKEDRGLPTIEAVAGDLVARELLAKACRIEEDRGEPGKPFYPRIFPSAEAIGQALTADETAVLFSAYLQAQNKWGPFEKTVQTEEELSQWIKRLVEGAREFPLSQISSVHWAELASLLAQRAYILSAILECLFESLPSSLRLRLGSYSLGTGFFGTPASKSAEDGNEGSEFITSRPEVTLEDATEFALKMRAANVDDAERALDIAEEHRD